MTRTAAMTLDEAEEIRNAEWCTSESLSWDKYQEAARLLGDTIVAPARDWQRTLAGYLVFGDDPRGPLYVPGSAVLLDTACCTAAYLAARWEAPLVLWWPDTQRECYVPVGATSWSIWHTLEGPSARQPGWPPRYALHNEHGQSAEETALCPECYGAAEHQAYAREMAASSADLDPAGPFLAARCEDALICCICEDVDIVAEFEEESSTADPEQRAAEDAAIRRGQLVEATRLAHDLYTAWPDLLWAADVLGDVLSRRIYGCGSQVLGVAYFFPQSPAPELRFSQDNVAAVVAQAAVAHAAHWHMDVEAVWQDRAAGVTVSSDPVYVSRALRKAKPRTLRSVLPVAAAPATGRSRVIDLAGA